MTRERCLSSLISCLLSSSLSFLFTPTALRRQCGFGDLKHEKEDTFFLFFSNGITILRTKSIFCLLVIATEWKISARCLVKFRPLSTKPKSLIILIRHHISIPRNTTQWLLYSKYQNIVFRILYYSYAIQAIWLHLLIKSWGPCMLEWKLSFP